MHLRSRSVESSPSRNACALLPNNPPGPPWPKVAKCWAWSIISRRRPLKAWSGIKQTILVWVRPSARLNQQLRHVICLFFAETEKKINCFVGGKMRNAYTHIHDCLSKTIPEVSSSHKIRQPNTAWFCFQCVAYSGSKRRWDVEFCPVTSRGRE